jgi:membrane-bound serine protease (ClpP class)
MRNLARAARLGVGVLVIALWFPLALAASAQTSGVVVELSVDGVVDPFIADHVEDGLADAEREGASAVLLTIDTPGGLDSSMRQIVKAILNSDVPVIAYVSPEGARAASAGTFVLMAAHVAAMAPATNVGAAHPVGLSGAIASEKATNDAANYLVSLAERRGRDTAFAEDAVRESVSISAERALERGVIDLIASDIRALLDAVDGRPVELAGGTTETLRTSGAAVEQDRIGPFFGFLHALFDPNLVFLFFWLGLALIALEFFIPGGVSGTLGGLMLVTSLAALGMLPVQLIGVALLVASVVFFILELLHPGIGVPTAGGLVTLVLGGLFLFDSSVPGVSVSPFMIAPVALFAALFFGLVVQQAVRLRRRRVETRTDRIVGEEGVVVRDLDPTGIVLVASEEWTAESPSGPVRRGERIRVLALEGIRLKVEPATEEAPAMQAPEGGTT